jgi:Tfp pilus assembly protein PilF
MSHSRRLGNRRRVPAYAAAALLAAIVLGGLPRAAPAVTQLLRGQAAPEISLPTDQGATVTSAALKGQVVVLVFGELYHAKTRDACRQIDAVLKDPRLAELKITPVLIVSQSGSVSGGASGGTSGGTSGGATQPGDDALTGPVPAVILHDTKREAYGAYQVAVLPSVVVVDAQGKVAHSIAGLIPQLSDTLRDSLLFASGKLSAERFEQALHPQATTQASDQEIKAERLAQLARQLARRGLDDMAADKYAEAIALNPADATARLGLGQLLLARRRLAEAEVQFRAVLAAQPEALDGNLGLAFVQTLRGGAELGDAEKTVRQVLVRNPSQPRAHYLMGLILQKNGKIEDAAASFRKAAELYMERTEE